MPANFENFINTTFIRFYRDFTTTQSYHTQHEYWPMAREYSIWNATIASLQFWTEDLNPVTLGRATEHVYTTFFYLPVSHTLHQQSDETLFGHFVIALNAAFDQQLLLADEGYKSGSDTINLPTPLRKTPCITMFAAWNMLHSTQFPLHHAVHHKLHPDQCADAYPLVQQTTTLWTAPPICSDNSEDEEEDFQMVPLDNEHWTSEETPDRTLCIYEHGLPHGLCQYPCPYMNYETLSNMDSLDLSDISDYEAYMVTIQ